MGRLLMIGIVAWVTALGWPVRAQVHNAEAVIPPMCYTKTEGRHNPCYVCHQTYHDKRPNQMDDGNLQGEYAFSEVGVHNHWTNLFEDRSAGIAAQSDGEIMTYVGQDNYAALAGNLRALGWKGWIPDLKGLAQGRAAFDETGLARDGSGWVAFNYIPLPSTFWPSNGATDDVMIRLPKAFRLDEDGKFSRHVTFANLGLLEASFQEWNSVSVPPIDEAHVGVDLNGDGVLGMTDRVVARSHYVGAAKKEPVARMLYPQGTEFLHSVRYVGLEGNRVVIPPRMKELRYMRKMRFLSMPKLASIYGNEVQEKLDEQLPRWSPVLTSAGYEKSAMGWQVLGFIEDKDGALRPQTYEEHGFCMGCHSTIGTSIDQTFAFPRKVAGAKGWGYMDLAGLKDRPSRGETEGEILTYFKRVGGGSEFRENGEIAARWFDANGKVKENAVRDADVASLITPSPERARLLNKAYRTIVWDQDFIHGRDPNLAPATNVYRDIDPATTQPLRPEFRHQWDIRLDWREGM
ncbi:hypothetical protein [Magnetospira sp. QH-2]|uniref:hypothetical protein n=1 Tax=Magnetospira sp. (strain QH-2) TaxID=1288970 RepID=UPI0003E80BD5|nr:hypothetical protein [Magnetospira sp. QH-2]CCQ74277.1 Conserved exported protein of unknown function [Magnetospira sp. QH-2]